MLFKNLTFFRFLPEVLENHDLESCLTENALQPVGPTSLASHGFVSPFAKDDAAMHHRIGNWILVARACQKRILPKAAVNDEVAKRVRERQRAGAAVGKRALRQIKEEVVFEMLPKAFTATTRTFAHIDLKHGFIAVDTTTAKVAEDICTGLRVALGSFPAVPLAPRVDPRTILTGWLESGPSAPWLLGHAAEMKDPVEKGAVAKLQRQDLEAEEALCHLEAGKCVARVEVVWRDRLALTLGEDLVIRKLQGTDLLNEGRDPASGGEAAEIDGQYALLAAELDGLFESLAETFSLQPIETASQFRLAA